MPPDLVGVLPAGILQLLSKRHERRGVLASTIFAAGARWLELLESLRSRLIQFSHASSCCSAAAEEV